MKGLVVKSLLNSISFALAPQEMRRVEPIE
jgi:hypothetical protein